MENGQFSGQLKFNFNNSNNETIDVTEDFNEAYIQVELNGASNIDKNTVKVKINDKTYKYKRINHMVHIQNTRSYDFCRGTS